jgi:hypothetical protein
MKNPILILCFIAFSTSLFAQNPRIETIGDRRAETYNFIKGGDSVRFTIIGKNDTVQEAQFYRSGKFSHIEWQTDSSHYFNVLGQITNKYFSKKEKGLSRDSSISFHRNGKPQEISSSFDGHHVTKKYAENGVVLLTEVEHYVKSPQNNQHFIGASHTYDRHNIPIYASDLTLKYEGKKAIYILQDTVFSETGIPVKTTIQHRPDSFIYLETRVMDGSNHLMDRDRYDTLNQNIFKDNLNCLYGVHNNRGDTLIKPLFDRIELLDRKLWVAYSGEILQLYKLDGERILASSPNLTYIEKNKNSYKSDKENIYEKDVDKLERARLIDQVPTEFMNSSYFPAGTENAEKKKKEYLEVDKSRVAFYSFTDGEKFGVMDENGAIVLTPQSLPLTNNNVAYGLFFEFEEFKQNQWREMGFIDRQGKRLFDERFTLARYTNYEDYFTLALYSTEISSGTNFDAPYNSLGLGKAGGEIILPNQFSSIEHIPNTDFFVAEVTHKRDKNTNDTLYQRIKYDYHQGLFNVSTRKWILDTLESFYIFSPAEPNNPFFIVQKTSKNKSGIIDTAGKILLPYEYDLVTLIDNDEHSYWIKKNKKYQFLNIKDGKVNMHKPKYDFLSPVIFQNLYAHNGTEDVTFFYAKHGNKWGIVDAHDNIIAPFEFDYASNSNGNSESIILIKNGQANFYSIYSLPNIDQNPYNTFNSESSTIKSKLHVLKVLDNNREYLVNDSGKVVLPPQYKLLYHDFEGTFVQIMDEKDRKKIVFLETGKVIDFPFDYQIKDVLSNGRALIVEGSPQNGFGVISTTGKILVPCNNYNIAIGDILKRTLFIKQDTPITWLSRFSEENTTLPDTYSHTYPDTLTQEDTNWLMYNSDGRQLSSSPFRFPINFKNGLGIGMKDAGFNLYTTEGSILTPFAKNREGSKNLLKDETFKNQGFTNIRRDSKLGYYTFFYTQGLTPVLMVTNQNGEIVVEAGRYDGISKFYGKYALATTKGKVALINSEGQEVIPPQDLWTYKGHFMDSLALANKIYLFKYENTNLYEYDSLVRQPLDFVSPRLHPDSLKITDFQRSSLWNLMLEKCLSHVILTASDVQIPRVEHLRSVTNYSMFTEEYRHRKGKTVYKIEITDSTMALCLNDDTRTGKYLEFYNFYRHNNRWEELQINDLLQIQGEKRWQMNELITKKVKSLKDQQIDCSNSSAFITTVENRWLLTKEGIDFCFDDSDGNGFVVISFTWAELAPFLKMKIF